MATTNKSIDVASARFRSTVFPATVKANGTSILIFGLAFDAGTDEAAFFAFRATGYGSGNLTLTIHWYADTATTNSEVWGASIGAITAGTDTTDVEAKSLATENTTTTAARTSAQALQTTDITISNLDSIANGDLLLLRLRRVGSNGSDTMSGDAIAVALTLSYSDS